MSDMAARFETLQSALGRHLIDLGGLTERLLLGLLTGRHVLVEGAPGLAKTRSVKELAQATGARFERVQCTPDLLPSDITGSLVFRAEGGSFEFVEGPIFANLVLVDEINRSPPKVQSALLEAMEERQVTVGRRTYPLPEPFLLVATQNPIEYEGTFPLPEAQLDRFLLKYVVPMPDRLAEMRILDLVEAEALSPPWLPPVLGSADVMAARDEVARVHVSAALKDYVIRLVGQTREGEAADLIEHPVSPRGSIALVAAARARAYLHGRDHTLPDDVDALAVDVLAHRLGLTWRALAEEHDARSVVSGILKRTDPL